MTDNIWALKRLIWPIRRNEIMRKKFEAIISVLLISEGGDNFLSEINSAAQFNPDEEDSLSISRNLNAAFMISLTGESSPLYKTATCYLNDFQFHPSWRNTVSFYKNGIELIRSEISKRCHIDNEFERDLEDLHLWVTGTEYRKDRKETINKIYKVFFPEGVSLSDPDKREENIELLRKKRLIKLSKLNSSPVTDPAEEILFTSNILITTPSALTITDSHAVDPRLKQALQQITQEEQMYWYDHPIPVGVAPENNEVLYGLEGLDRAIEYEKEHGNIAKGLQGIVKEYLESELRKEKNIRHLEVHIFTESDTVKLIKDILIPAAVKYECMEDNSLLYAVIGVDGEYGRHYSFLKAVAAFWQVFINQDVKATFKIDLDQIFPQKLLEEQSGCSAFEHLKSPLWGAEGLDSDGDGIELGMIAGALVNKKDCDKSLFYPDVRFPDNEIIEDRLIFNSTLPQALSTEAEMMTRYSEKPFYGEKQCIQRIHVTGGTCGILIDSLRRYQPFTPTFIGRAEDQAYIFSILLNDKLRKLRYVHKDGLIMRHDKEDFAGDAIKYAATGKLIGDYIRILMFSYYVRALPWSFKDIKNAIDPFTGCFVSKIPLTVVYLRFALKAASFFNNNTKIKNQEGFEFLQAGIRRLHEKIQELTGEPCPLIERFNRERQGWNFYYNILDIVEKNIRKGDPFAIELQKKAKELVKGCKINFSSDQGK
jgi:hypothetical protein